MEFDSLPFIFVFLPVALIGFFAASHFGRGTLLIFMSLISLVFYGYWDYRFVPLLAGSVCFNYLVGCAICAASERGERALVHVAIGIAFNLALLGYFKYAGFFLENGSNLFDTNLEWQEVVLPLGISFFTFQQIAFLVDVKKGRIKTFDFVEYSAFVTFFPQLIAGPIVHFREVLPQFRTQYFGTIATNRLLNNFSVGIAFFAIGLFKKAVIADEMGAYADPVFTAADAGQPLYLLESWGAALAFTLQIYFDFSGYSDMAIGLARMFGIRLPENFFAPYQAHNIVEFWRRWHMTLSAFLKDHLYIPLGGNRHGVARRYFSLAATMLLGGLWHGAAWTFVAWGALHGIFLILCHGFGRLVDTNRWRGARVISTGLTFLSVVFAWVLFRAETFGGAVTMWRSMSGVEGIQLPLAIQDGLAPAHGALDALGIGFTTYTYWFGFDQWIFLILALGACFLLPPSQVVLRKHRPVIRYVRRIHPAHTIERLRAGWPQAIVMTSVVLCTFLVWIPRADGGALASLALVVMSIGTVFWMAFLRWDVLALRPNFLGVIWAASAFCLGVVFSFRGRGDAFIYFQF